MQTNAPNVTSARFEAAYLIRKYGISAPEDIDLEDIAWALGVHIKCARLQGAEAWLFRKGQQGIIRVNDRIQNPRRRRFTIGHELGHWKCHFNQSQGWICSTGDIHAYRGSAAEVEANAFAAELLIPKQMLCAYLAGRDLSFAQVCDVAEHFDTTLTSTAVRLVEESKDPCCVIFSQDDCVKWHRCSGTGFGFWLPRNFSLDMESRAYNCQIEPSDSSGPRKVPLSAWIKGRNPESFSEIWEESVLLPEYRTVVTLLSFA